MIRDNNKSVKVNFCKHDLQQKRQQQKCSKSLKFKFKLENETRVLMCVYESGLEYKNADIYREIEQNSTTERVLEHLMTRGTRF